MNARTLGLARYKMRWRILEALEAQKPSLGLQDIADRVDISYQAVRRTFLGDLHSQRVLQAFRDAGVPEKYLFDPRRQGLRLRGYGLAGEAKQSDPNPEAQHA